MRLRKKITSKIGLNKALRVLSREFPGGSAKGYIQTRSLEVDIEDDDNIIISISEELIKKYKDDVIN